jgi:hypothetical protein
LYLGSIYSLLEFEASLLSFFHRGHAYNPNATKSSMRCSQTQSIPSEAS